jgi:hypothetical protein
VLSIECSGWTNCIGTFTSPVETQDFASCALCVKFSERMVSLLGLNAPGSLDATQLTDQQLLKTSTQRIREVITVAWHRTAEAGL